MANDIKVVIGQKQALGKVGFGVPLIMAGHVAEGDTIAYTECTGMDGVTAAVASKACGADIKAAAQLLFQQDNAPDRVAICAVKEGVDAALSGIWHENWRQLIVTSIGEEKDDAAAISDYFETKDEKLFFTSAADAASIPEGVAGNERTVVLVYKAAQDTAVVCPEAALVGASAGLTPGSFTYKNLIIRGLPAQSYDESTLGGITEEHGITIVTKAGDIVTSEGKSASGEYIDVIDTKDYIVSNLEYKSQRMLNTLPKVPYDNSGIAALQSVAVDVLRDAYNKGMIATNADGSAAYRVDYAMREETTEDDRAARKYLGGKFSFTVAGAIHTAEITGELVI